MLVFCCCAHVGALLCMRWSVHMSECARTAKELTGMCMVTYVRIHMYVCTYLCLSSPAYS